MHDKCFYCKALLPKEGFVYMMGGACADEMAELKMATSISGYLYIGLHSNPDMYSVNNEIVDDIEGGQFDIAFCSFYCVKKWFLSTVLKLEHEYNGICLPNDRGHMYECPCQTIVCDFENSKLDADAVPVQNLCETLKTPDSDPKTGDVEK